MLGLKLDDWQLKVMQTKGNLCLRSGRQVGKSTIIALKAAKYALENPNKKIMVIAYVEKQALLIFSKILNNIVRINPKMVAKPKPTKHILKLKNGSEIYCYAAGETGYGIMGYTLDLLIADEAAFIAEEVFNSVTPALATTGGIIWLLSTPKLREGYYYECFKNPDFTSFHQSSENCPRIPSKFLESKKKEFTKAQYAQMYLGEWLDEFNRLFSDDWINKVCTIETKPILSISNDNLYLGVDIAGMGDDESSFEGLMRRGDVIQQFHHETTTKTMPTETEDKIKDLNAHYDFKQIGVDDGGMGVGVLAHLLLYDPTKFKTVGLNNAKRVIDSDDRQTRLYKEAMYINLLMLGEQGVLKLFDNEEVRASLRSIQGEDTPTGVKINGIYSHITEGIIRAAWLAKEKELNIKVYTIKV